MGRAQYLERLALGRSAFQPGTEKNGAHPVESLSTSAGPPGTSESTRSYTQQYDNKGRPENLVADAQNARLRHASNEVLALVGVVERKDSADARMQEVTHLRRALREQSLIREDNRGNEWSAVVDVVSWFALWWPTALVRRMQIGLYSTSLPFMEILRCEASAMFGNGWRGLLLGLLPGTGIAIMHKVIWQVFALIAEESIGALQNQVVLSKMRRRKARIIIRSLAVFADICLIAIDLLLLPLETYALAQQLSIVPPTPWRPLLTTHLPYFFRAAYSTTFASPASFLTSAAPYLIGYSFLTRDPSPEAPAFNDLTSYRLPVVSERDYRRSYSYSPPSILSDPFAAVLHSTWTLRQRFMRFVGWNLYEKAPPGALHGWETDEHYLIPYDSFDPKVDPKVVAHRSTALARLPATWLGMRVDMFIIRLLLLPVEGMVMRKVAQFYMSTGMQVTSGAASIGNLIPNMLGLITGKSGAKEWDLVLNSQLGLSMALNLGVEAFFFGCVYALVRRQGISIFGWGKNTNE